MSFNRPFQQARNSQLGGLSVFWQNHIAPIKNTVSHYLKVVKNKSYSKWGPEKKQALKDLQRLMAQGNPLRPHDPTDYVRISTS